MNADVFEAVCAMGDAARTAQSQLAQANTEAKNQLLNAIADALDQHADDIAAANTLDMNQAETDGMDAGKLDRLKFDQQRITAAAQGVRHVASLPDPIGEIVRGYHLENGLRLQQVRVPIGVLGMIYEARPNVTVDVASLCIKSGNAVLLRGGHAAEHTNAATLAVIADVLTTIGAPVAAMEVMNAKLEKDLRGSVNRRVNCDAANLDKVVEAAQAQLEAIRRLEGIRCGGKPTSCPDQIAQALKTAQQ